MGAIGEQANDLEQVQEEENGDENGSDGEESENDASKDKSGATPSDISKAKTKKSQLTAAQT